MTRRWRALLIAGVLAAPALPANTAAGAAAEPSVPFRAHVLQDDSHGPWLPGVAVGAPADPLRHPRLSLSARVPLPVGTTTRPAAAGSGRSAPPDPEVLGFAQAGEVSGGGWRNDLQLNMLSTIAYFGVNMNGDGSLYTADTGYQTWWSSQTTSLIDAAHAAGDRVVLTVKAFDDPTIASITGSEQYRQNAVATIIAQLQSRGGDGINIDFEGFDASVAANFTTFISELQYALRSRIPAQSYLTVDTYASAASGGTMYDVGGLSPYVDAFDVMAYDITSPGSAHAGPVAPLSGMTYADTNTVNDFLRMVPASEVILGVPYYGYKWSTTSNQPQAPTTGTATADTYSGVVDDFGCAAQLSRNWDPTFASPWASWYSPASGDPCGGNHNSWRELYYEDTTSLGYKYDLVNQDHLRGIGIWALGYDSGHQELWNEIGAKFTVTHAPSPQMTPLAASESSTAFPLSWSVPSGSPTVDRYVVYARDGQGAWLTWTTEPGTSTTFYGFPGHAYAFFVEAFVGGGYGSGSPGATGMASTTVATKASPAAPFKSMYGVDAFGVLHPASSPPLPVSGFYPGWNIIRGITGEPSGQGGLTLDGWGGLHPFGDSAGATSSGYWHGWDITRGVAGLPTGSGGVVLDGFGALHPYSVGGAAMPWPVTCTAYWPDWDIARGVTTFGDGSGGVVLDGWGGIHPFSIGAAAPPAGPTVTAYWRGWDIARGVVLLPGSSPAGYSGFVLDGWGGLHPFAAGAAAMPAASNVSGYWAGNDIARAVVMVPGSGTEGYVAEGFGGFWPFGGAPSVGTPNYGVDAPAVRAAAVS